MTTKEPWEKAAREVHNEGAQRRVEIIKKACLEYAASDEWKSESDARRAAMEVSLKVAYDEMVECKSALLAAESRLALYDTACEIITSPNGKVWVAAEKHETVVDELQQQLDDVNNGVASMAYVRKKQDEIVDRLREALQNLYDAHLTKDTIDDPAMKNAREALTSTPQKPSLHQPPPA